MPEAKSIFKTFLPESVDVNAVERKSIFTISSGTVDRDNDIVNPDGWDFSEYRKNPIILWAHDAKIPPVAKSTREWVVDGRVRSVAEWPEQGISKFADEIFALVQGGFIRGTSVGFRPIAAEPRQKGGFHYQRQELMEYSVLPIPSNRDALREAKGAGLETGLALEWCKKAIESSEDGIWLPKDLVEKAIMLAEPKVAGFRAKGSDDQARDDHGRFASGGHVAQAGEKPPKTATADSKTPSEKPGPGKTYRLADRRGRAYYGHVSHDGRSLSIDTESKRGMHGIDSVGIHPETGALPEGSTFSYSTHGKSADVDVEKKFSDETHSRAGGKFTGMTHGDRSLIEQAGVGAARFPGHKRHPLDVATERDAMTAAHRMIASDGRTKPLTDDEKALLGHMAARVQPGKGVDTTSASPIVPPAQGDPTKPKKPAKLPKKEPDMLVVLSQEKIDKYIKHEDGQYTVHAESGKSLGSYKSEGEAKKRLAQVEYFKRRGKKSFKARVKEILGKYRDTSGQAAAQHDKDEAQNAAQIADRKATKKKLKAMAKRFVMKADPKHFEVADAEISADILDGITKGIEANASLFTEDEYKKFANSVLKAAGVELTIKVPGDVGPTADESCYAFGQHDLEAQPDSETATYADDGDNDDLTSEDVDIMTLAQKLFSEDKGANPFPKGKKTPPKDGADGGDGADGADPKGKPSGKLKPPTPPADDASPEEHAQHAQDAASYAQAAQAKAKEKAGGDQQGTPDARGQDGGDQQNPNPNAKPGDPSKLQADMKQVEQQITAIQPGDPATVATQLKTILESFAAIVMQDLTGVQNPNNPGAGGSPTPPGQASNAPGQMPQTQRGSEPNVVKDASDALGISPEEIAEIVAGGDVEAAEFEEWCQKEFGMTSKEFMALTAEAVDAKMDKLTGRLPD